MVRVSLVLAAAVFAAACDRIALGPPQADSAPASAPAVAPEVGPFVGRPYSEFAGDPELVERYSAEALGLTAAEQARFEAAMAASQPGGIAAGGGAEALVFIGCAEAGCAAGRAVLAIDTETGAAFLGVRDEEGADALRPNPRLEALLRLTSPARRWDQPVLSDSTSADAGRP